MDKTKLSVEEMVKIGKNIGEWSGRVNCEGHECFATPYIHKKPYKFVGSIEDVYISIIKTRSGLYDISAHSKGIELGMTYNAKNPEVKKLFEDQISKIDKVEEGKINDAFFKARDLLAKIS